MNLNYKSESDLIKDHFRQELEKQQEDIIFYINECMTQEERQRHGDNLWNLIVRAEPSFALLEMKLIAYSSKQIKKMKHFYVLVIISLWLITQWLTHDCYWFNFTLNLICIIAMTYSISYHCEKSKLK